MTDETLTQPNEENAVLKAIAELSKQLNGRIDDLNGRIDELEKSVKIRFESVDAQFEAIRVGIVGNYASFDRLQAAVYSMRANLTELTEEVRQSHKVLA